MLTGFQRTLTKLTFNEMDRIDLYDNFRQYLLDGVDVNTIYLKLIEGYTRRGKKPNHPIAEILRECKLSLDGNSLADSLSEWVPERELSLIAANESANRPAEGFEKAISLCKNIYDLKSSIKQVLFLVSFLFFAFFMLICVICMGIVPQILKTTPLYMWSDLQKAVYYFYIFIVDYWYLFLLFVFGIAYIVNRSLSRWVGNSRYYADKLFPYSLYRVMNGAIFISNMDAMLSSGIPLKEALLKMKDMSGSSWLNERIDGVIQALGSGESNLGRALDVSGYDFPSEDAIIKLSCLLDTSNREGSLTKFSNRWLESTVKSIEGIGASVQKWGVIVAALGVISVCAILFPLISGSFIK